MCEIRHGRISRQIGKKLSDYYGQQKPKNMKLLLEWLGLNEQSLNYLFKPDTIQGKKATESESKVKEWKSLKARTSKHFSKFIAAGAKRSSAYFIGKGNVEILKLVHDQQKSSTAIKLILEAVKLLIIQPELLLNIESLRV